MTNANKWLRYKQVAESEPYRKLAEAAVSRLALKGHFSKEQILEETRQIVIGEEAFRWDYLKKMIEEQQNTELIPLATTFFKRHNAEQARSFPGKYIAHGFGKKTAGFCIASQANGHFVLEQLKLKTGRAEGMIRSRDKTRRIGQAAGIPSLMPPSAPDDEAHG